MRALVHTEVKGLSRNQMPQVKAESTFGNYKWFANAEISAEQAATLANLGFLWIMQRSPSSNAEKVMAGYEKRPEGFKRNSIDFSDAGVKTLSTELSKAIEIADGQSITPVVSKVVFHEIGAGAEPKFAEEKRIVARHVEAKDIATWAIDKVGFTGEGDLDTENVEFLKAVKAYKQRILADS